MKYALRLIPAVTILSTLLHAADPQRIPWANSKIVGTPEPPFAYQIKPVFPDISFDHPTSIEIFPDRPSLLITERTGKLFLVNIQAQTARPQQLADLSVIAGGKPVSVLDAEFHPRYSENRYLFVCYVHPGNSGHTRVSRFTLANRNSPTILTESEHVVITWPTGGHNAGCLEFGKDGLLYISTGDGSGPNPPDGLTTGQDVSDLLGAILRLDVDQTDANQSYRIPPDNPFINRPNTRPEIWAYGLRNPWKFSPDPDSGDVYIADNGWETWELIYRARGGTNCGWPIMEGRASLRSEVPLGPTPIVPPIKDHHHSEANSVIGGPVYQGKKLADLRGSFIYGGYITGTIWAVKPNPEGTYSAATLTDTDLRIVAFTEGHHGEVFVLDYDYTGQIYQLVTSDQEDRSQDFPRRLSQTGIFTSLDPLEVSAGVEPYEVTAPRWHDGASTKRWIAIPGSDSLEFDGTRFKFPQGTVLVKNLYLDLYGRPGAPIETQILHLENGTWNPYSYKWNADGDEAELVSSIGAKHTIEVRDSVSDQPIQRTWHINAVNECRLCHNAGSQFVLGFEPFQLERNALSPEATRQLDRLHRLGITRTNLQFDEKDARQLVDPHGNAGTLDDRARSYLHANCSSCHHPGGNAIVSFFLKRELPFEQLNTNKGTGIGTFGMTDPKIIKPGDPFRSVVFYRMSKLGYSHMPYIGSQVVDSKGITLIEEWIRSMQPNDRNDLSPPLQSSSSDHVAIQNILAAKNNDDANDHDFELLTSTTEGSLALMTSMHRGDLNANRIRQIATFGSALSSSDRSGLFETFLPESMRRKRLGPDVDPGEILQLTGNLERGRLIYFSDSARCQTCHDPSNKEKSVGPTLYEIVTKHKTTAELLTHVIDPSKQIDDAFQTYSVITDDGSITTGLISERTSSQLTITTSEKKVKRIKTSNIDQTVRSTKSLMPDQLLSDLTAQEAADLLKFIESFRQPTR